MRLVLMGPTDDSKWVTTPELLPPGRPTRVGRAGEFTFSLPEGGTAREVIT